MVLTFKFVDANLGSCVSEPNVWPFKWKLLSGTVYYAVQGDFTFYVSVTTEMEAIEKYFHVVLSILRRRPSPTFL